MNNLKVKKIFTSFTLKCICLILMTAGMVIVQLNSPYFRELEDLNWTIPKKTVKLMKLGYNIYYIGVPIACFLIAEGCMKSRNIVKFIVRMGVAAVITELVFDYVTYGADRMFDFSNGISGNVAIKNTPNFFFTLLLGLICISVMEYVIAKKFTQGTVFYNLLNLLIVIGGVLLAYFGRLEHGGVGVFMIFAMYLFYGNGYLSMLAVAAIQIVMLGKASGFFMYTPVVGTLVTCFYNGEKGADGKAVRFFSYVLYPLAYVIVVYCLKKNGII